jgi:hypothetical protein
LDISNTFQRSRTNILLWLQSPESYSFAWHESFGVPDWNNIYNVLVPSSIASAAAHKCYSCFAHSVATYLECYSFFSEQIIA